MADPSRIQVELAIAYRAPGLARRFLLLSSAVGAYCRRRLKVGHPCECEADIGYVCGLHKTDPSDLFTEVLPARYRRLCTRAFKADRDFIEQQAAARRLPREFKAVFKAWREWRVTPDLFPGEDVLEAVHGLEETLVTLGLVEPDTTDEWGSSTHAQAGDSP